MSDNEFSFGQLVERTGKPHWVIRNILSGRKIKPCRTFAGCNVYDQNALEAVLGVLAEREGEAAGTIRTVGGLDLKAVPQ